MRDDSGVARIVEPHNNKVCSEFVSSFKDPLAYGRSCCKFRVQLRSRVEPGIIGEFCQLLHSSHARIFLPVCQSLFGARWRRWNDTQKGELGFELIGSRNGSRQTVKRCGSEVCREQECAVRGGRSKPWAGISVWPKGQDRTICLTENLFRD